MCYVKAPRAVTPAAGAASGFGLDRAAAAADSPLASGLSFWADIAACGADPLAAPSHDELSVLDSLSTDNLDVWLDLLASNSTKQDAFSQKQPELDASSLQPSAAQIANIKGEPASLQSPAGFSSAMQLFPSPPNSFIASSSQDANLCSASSLSIPLDDMTSTSSLTPESIFMQQHQRYPFDAATASAATAAAMGIPLNLSQLPLFPSLTTQTPSPVLQQQQRDAMSITSAKSLVPPKQSADASRSCQASKRKAQDDIQAAMPDDDTTLTLNDCEDLAAIKGSHPDGSLLAIKRARNNEAARRSRERKMRRLEELETQVVSLETEKSDLNVRVAVLENERSTWMNRERELMQRVLALESQLGESHRALMQVGLVHPTASATSATLATARPSQA